MLDERGAALLALATGVLDDTALAGCVGTCECRGFKPGMEKA